MRISSRQNPELIRLALENAAGQALKHAEPELKEAVRRGYLHDGGPLEASKGVERVFTSYQRQAEDTANLVNTVMLDSGMQSYRRVVSDVVQYEQAAMAVTQVDAAQNILNTETGKVLTGVSSRQEALRPAIKRMADNRLTGFVDRGGPNRQPETYINMDIPPTPSSPHLTPITTFPLSTFTIFSPSSTYLTTIPAFSYSTTSYTTPR